MGNRWSFPIPMEKDQFVAYTDAEANHIHVSTEPKTCTVFCSRIASINHVALVNGLVLLAAFLTGWLVVVQIVKALF